MTKRIKSYSVGELARMSGVTVRTLHHYDAIGLLRPAHTALNGYRSYGRAEALRLQEILFYRSFGLSLADIASVLDKEPDHLSRLQQHRAALQEQMLHTAELLKSLDRTIIELTKGPDMANEDLYTPFDAATQTAHEEWLIDTYGADMAAAIATSKQAVAKLPDGIAGAMARLSDYETSLVAEFQQGRAADDGELDDILSKHRALMAELWGKPCPPEAYAGLADMYLSHPDFVARYERLAPRFSQWLPAAMKSYAGRNEGG